MINPFQIATEGVGPGWTAFNMATRGFGFDIEIIFPPSAGGGPWGVTTGELPVLIRVGRNGKIWEKVIYLSPMKIKTLEDIVARFKGIKKKMVEMFAKLNTVIKESIQVRIRK